MEPGKYTCKDGRMAKQSTGRTPVRNLRMADERWLPALAKAEAEGRTITDVIDAYLGEYTAEPMAGARQFTLANWPEARGWIGERSTALGALTKDIDDAVGQVPLEWLSIAAWLASTRHPADEGQQRRVLTGHIIGRAIDMPADAAWRAKYRDTRHLLDTVQAILDERLPLTED